MKIRSISDVITNSSSEVFCLHYPEVNRKELLQELKSLGEDGSSGMGGMIEVVPLAEVTQEIAYLDRIPWTPGGFMIHIDWALKETIGYLRSHYPEVYNTEETIMYPVYDPSGETLQRLTPDYKEWKALGDPLRMHGEWAVSEMEWWNHETRD